MTRRKQCQLLGVLSLFGCMLLGGCAPRNTDTGAEILIGEYASMTGTTATYGQSGHKGTMLAVEEINAKGGILGKKIKVLTEDTQSKPEEAASAVNKLINKNRVVAVLGEFASSRSLAGAPICQASRIPMLSPGSTNPEVTQKGDYIFRDCFIDSFQGKVLAKFAFNSLKLRKVAILTDVKNDYSVGLTQYFKETFIKLGGEIVEEQSYTEGDTDFKGQLTAIKQKNPEAVLLPGYYTEAALVLKQARALRITVPFLGGDGWDSDQLLAVGGSDLNGCYFSNHYSADSEAPVVQDFVAAYKNKYHETPNAMAALSYDGLKLLADAIVRANSTDPAKIRDALAQTKDFQGVTGRISMDANRNANKSAAILQIKDAKIHFFETVEPDLL